VISQKQKSRVRRRTAQKITFDGTKQRKNRRGAHREFGILSRNSSRKREQLLRDASTIFAVACAAIFFCILL
jgi:hypothetical protein